MTAPPLTQAHITAQERLRAITTVAVANAWRHLPGYDENNVQQWLDAVVPIVVAAQRQSVAVTNAYLARALKTGPAPVNAAQVAAAARNGTSPTTVYRRPFITVWTALQNGTPWTDAVDEGLHRATAAAATDIQLAARATFAAVQDADPGIRGYRRVPDAGACQFCLTVAGAIVKSARAMPLHPHCGCSLEPVIDTVADTPLPDTVAVHDHGELGPVLAAPGQHFTTEHELP